MEIPFYKIHGAGNDCIVFFTKDFIGGPASKKAFIQKISHRHLGIGADQVLELLSLKPLALQIWNCDGSRAEMCGNGVRAFASLALKKGWITNIQNAKKSTEIPILISGKKYSLQKIGSNFSLHLGSPKIKGQKTLRLGKEKIPYSFVDTGNPHTVIFMAGNDSCWAKPKDFHFEKYGPKIECHSDFPKKTNVEFVRKITIKKKYVELGVEVWERGAGATLSCGSGAVAVAAAYREKYQTKIQTFHIQMNACTLVVQFTGNEAYLSGPSEFIAEGNYFY